MFICFCLCHGQNLDDNKDFVGSSEDERALLHAAKKMGYCFVSRKNNVLSVKINHQLHQYQIIAQLPFDSTRKMMSVVVEMPDG